MSEQASKLGGREEGRSKGRDVEREGKREREIEKSFLVCDARVFLGRSSPEFLEG